jgi:prefoldin subunit 5
MNTDAYKQAKASDKSNSIVDVANSGNYIAKRLTKNPISLQTRIDDYVANARKKQEEIEKKYTDNSYKLYESLRNNPSLMTKEKTADKTEYVPLTPGERIQQYVNNMMSMLNKLMRILH